METKSNNYGVLMALVPLICLLTVSTTAFLQYKKLSGLNENISKTDQEIALWERKLKEIQYMPAATRIAALPLTTQEQPNFFNWLRMTAVNSKVELTKWSNAAVPAPPPPSQADANKGQPAPSPYPKGIAPLMSDVEVSGNYNNVRDYLYRILASPRVLTLTGVKWTRGDKWPQTKVTFSVTRYVYTEPNASHGGAN